MRDPRPHTRLAVAPFLVAWPAPRLRALDAPLDGVMGSSAGTGGPHTAVVSPPLDVSSAKTHPHWCTGPHPHRCVPVYRSPCHTAPHQHRLRDRT